MVAKLLSHLIHQSGESEFKSGQSIRLAPYHKSSKDNWVAWATYSVQAESQDNWIAGNGVLGDDGWILDKTMLVGVLEGAESYTLLIHGTGP